MKFRLLGPVEAWVDGRVPELGRPQQRLLVAALAVAAGRPVPVDSPVDRIWGEAPSDPLLNLHVLVSRLRLVLEQVGVAGEVVPAVRRSGGYVLDVDPQQVDLLRYRGLLAQARRDMPDTDRVLRLWQGDPLAGLAGLWAARIARSLRQQHLDVVVAWAWAEVLTGNPGVVVGLLTGLVEEPPLAESLIEVLILAMAAAGRSAEALALYKNTRQRLADELGTDPGVDGTQLDFTEHGVDFQPVAPEGAFSNELTAAESIWLDAATNTTTWDGEEGTSCESTHQ